MVKASSHLIPQLGFLVACDVLGIDWRDTSDGNGDLLVGRGAERRRVPVDRHGLTLLNWHVPKDASDWRGSFVHAPAGRVLEIAENRRTIAENARRLAITMGELVQLRYAEAPAEYARYAELINQRTALRTALADPRDPPDAARLEADLAEVDRVIAAIEDDATVWLQRLKRLWDNEEPQTDQERRQVRRIEWLYAQLIEGELTDRLDAANAGLKQRAVQLIDELRPKIAGRICLVGVTATGVADLVATPIHPAMPGVMVHANVINSVLQNDLPHVAPLSANAALLLLAGLAIAAVTVSRGPVPSLAALGVMSAVVVAIGAGTFSAATVHLATFPALVTMTLSWGSVTVYRQLTEERTRRQLQQALGRYTSPAVAARIVERIRPDDLDPKLSQATCFFCDLAGFTPLSERLGPQRTRDVLNPYLGAVSDVLVEHRAIVNKFMGDGIFAFFNAPIWPCPQHAAAGCTSALRTVEAWGAVSGRAAELGDAGPHAIRVGLATGEVFVGDYGSDTKLDYTCIGDTVNVASRLEQANKLLKTTILVDERTRRLGGERFAARYLGLLEVQGRAAPVPTFELIGPADRLDAVTREYIAQFAQAVAYYQSCEWDACERTLQECRNLRPSDGAVDVYCRAVSRMRAAEPSADWNRAVTVTNL